MNSSKADYQRRLEYLAEFETLPEAQQTLRLALALRWLTALVERREAMSNAVMSCTPKQLEQML